MVVTFVYLHWQYKKLLILRDNGKEVHYCLIKNYTVQNFSKL